MQGLSDEVDSATDFMLDAKAQIQQMDDVVEDIKAGGEKAGFALFVFVFFGVASAQLTTATTHAYARKALARLIDLSNQCAQCPVCRAALDDDHCSTPGPMLSECMDLLAWPVCGESWR